MKARILKFIYTLALLIISCAVCLEEFKGTDVCRESICHHIFHRECLDTWLIKHEVPTNKNLLILNKYFYNNRNYRIVLIVGL